MRRVHFSSIFRDVWEHILFSWIIIRYKHMKISFICGYSQWGSKSMASFCPYHYQKVNHNSPRIWCWQSFSLLHETNRNRLVQVRSGLSFHSNLEVHNPSAVNFIEGKIEFSGDLVPLLEEIEQCPSSALSSQIVFLLSVYLQRNSCLYFSGLHNTRLEAGRWTHSTSGVMWQTLLWFNCCLGGNGGWVWHNDISQNNDHLVYIDSFFLWFQSKSQA